MAPKMLSLEQNPLQLLDGGNVSQKCPICIKRALRVSESKRTCVSSKEPYLHQKSPIYIKTGLFLKRVLYSIKRATGQWQSRSKMPVCQQKSPILDQKSLFLMKRALYSFQKATGMWQCASKEPCASSKKPVCDEKSPHSIQRSTGKWQCESKDPCASSKQSYVKSDQAGLQ